GVAARVPAPAPCIVVKCPNGPAEPEIVNPAPETGPLPVEATHPGPATAEERVIAALVEKGRLKEPDLLRARRLHAEAGGSLLGLLGRLGLVSERAHAETCAEVLGLRLLATRQVPDNPPELMEGAQPLSARFLRQFHLCPLGESGGRIVVWMADPFDDYAREAVRLA